MMEMWIWKVIVWSFYVANPIPLASSHFMQKYHSNRTNHIDLRTFDALDDHGSKSASRLQELALSHLFNLQKDTHHGALNSKPLHSPPVLHSLSWWNAVVASIRRMSTSATSTPWRKTGLFDPVFATDKVMTLLVELGPTGCCAQIGWLWELWVPRWAALCTTFLSAACAIVHSHP